MKNKGLGVAFITEIESVFRKIEDSPKRYTIVFKNIRRVLCKRFPYSIYFIENKSNVIVIAVLHQRRNPAIWQSRQ